ncbi:hypothetical protein ACFSZS_13800 [Seohaeicola zhoushanensis]
MEEAQIETAFATLFAERLAGLTLEDPAARAVAWRIQLLSADYEAAAQTPPDDSALSLFLAALAQGRPGEAPAPTQRAQAIANGFAPDAALPERVREALEAGRLGKRSCGRWTISTAGHAATPSTCPAPSPRCGWWALKT